MRRTFSLALTLGLLMATVAPTHASRIRVMTQNQFLGADLAPLLQAVGTPQQAEAFSAALAQMAANNFPLRAKALAQQICDRQPHVAGLQEVFRFELNGVSGPPAPPPFIDHLDELMAAIGEQCANYVVVASVKHSDIGQAVEGFGTVRFFDRDVLLTRDDVTSQPVPFSGNVCAPTESGVPGLPASGCHYQALVPLPPVIGGFVQRGYIGVDVTVNAMDYRVVTTHLEVMFPAPDPQSMGFQAAQATELLTVLSTFANLHDARIVVVGDMNSSPEDATNETLPFVAPYAQFTTGVDLNGILLETGERYTDVWNLRPGNDPGFTCCHDEDLSIQRVRHEERTDLIFSLEEPYRVKANVLGGEASDRIKGLWPSDHCTVVSDLKFDAPWRGPQVSRTTILGGTGERP